MTITGITAMYLTMPRWALANSHNRKILCTGQPCYADFR